MNVKQQKERILEYLLKHKEATGLELLKNCGVMCYTKAISQLRRTLPYEGYTITGEYITVNSKFNGKSRVMLYSLARLKKKAKR